mgnify:CR=1 FL=1
MNQIDNIIVLRSPHGHSARLRPLTAGRTLLLDTELPDSVQADDSGGVPLHPALVDEGESCSITLVENAAEAAAMISSFLLFFGGASAAPSVGFSSFAIYRSLLCC